MTGSISSEGSLLEMVMRLPFLLSLVTGCVGRAGGSVPIHS